MIPSTAGRVPEHTSDNVNRRIREQTERNVARIAAEGPAAVARRLAELDREWDIERTLEGNAATVILIGSALGAFVDRRFFVLPAVVAGFLLQHAVQGWCPPLPIFRRAGVRTAAEIDHERDSLKVLLRDFQQAAGLSSATASEPL